MPEVSGHLAAWFDFTVLLPVFQSVLFTAAGFSVG